MYLKNNTHVIIADSEKYLLLRNQGDEDIIDLRVVESETRENPPSRETAPDRPGRTPTPNSQLSAMSNANWHQIFKTESVTKTAKRVNFLDQGEQFAEIVVVADSKTLGVLRTQLSDHVQARIVSEIPKDLTHHTIPEIEKILTAA